MIVLNSATEYSISEAADIIGYAPHVLRFYEKEFDIDIPRKDSNHRFYTYREIELIQYIKDLKEKGFANKQIKLIINSPETILSKDIGKGLETEDHEGLVLNNEEFSLQIAEVIGENFLAKLTEFMSKDREYTISLVEGLKEEIITLKNEIHSKERDILITENAKLKMKVKEKTYENAKYKEELARLKSTKGSFLNKIFNFSSYK